MPSTDKKMLAVSVEDFDRVHKLRDQTGTLMYRLVREAIDLLVKKYEITNVIKKDIKEDNIALAKEFDLDHK